VDDADLKRNKQEEGKTGKKTPARRKMKEKLETEKSHAFLQLVDHRYRAGKKSERADGESGEA